MQQYFHYGCVRLNSDFFPHWNTLLPAQIFFYDALTGMWLEEKMTLAVSSYCLFHFRVLEVVDKRLGAICVHFTQICVFHKLPYSCCNCTGMRKYSFIIYLPNVNHS